MKALCTQFLFAIVSVLAATVPAEARTVTIDRLVDARDFHLGGNTVPLGDGFSMSVGDVLFLNFSFLPGQRILLGGPLALGGSAVSPRDEVDHFTYLDHQMWFAGLEGAAHDPAAKPDSVSGYFGFGAAYFAEDFLDDPLVDSISFSGLRFRFEINAYSDGRIAREYIGTSMDIIATSITVLAVREPPVAGICVLCLLALMSRRKGLGFRAA